MTTFDRFPVPVRSAVKSNLTNSSLANYSCISNTRSSADAKAPHDVPLIQNIALVKACDRRMTFKDTQGHHNCCY